MSGSKKIWAGAGVLARGAEAVGQRRGLGGQVKPGSMDWNPETMDLRFVVQDSLQEVRVHSTGAPPAMFQEGQGVIMEGHYRNDGTFESNNVMVKHSNEYEAPHEGQDPKKMYESLVKPDAE